MRICDVLLATAIFGFLGAQVILFSSYHHDADQLVEEVSKTTALQDKLADLVEESDNVRATFDDLEHRIELLSGPEDAAGSAAAAAEFAPGNEDLPCVGGPANLNGVVAAVVTIAFNRPEYLQRHMQSVLEIHGRKSVNSRKFPLHISQDGAHEGTRDAARAFLPKVRYLSHFELEAPIPRQRRENVAYYRIANHYKFIFHTFFDCFQYPRLIILEDDMQLAPDFFSYFEATAPLLSSDPTLYCVSSWNDHGQDRFVKDPLQLYRTDFFPGLGWMTDRGTWDGFRESWPDSYWDDWMRLNSTRQGRQCIRPEICRNFNFGERGSSRGQYYRRFLKPIKLNDLDIDWQNQDLSYLAPDRYQAEVHGRLQEAELVSDTNAAMAAKGPVKLLYDSQEQYESITAAMSMLREWKDGVPRQGYHGIVTIKANEATIFIAPSDAFVPSSRSEDASPAKVDASGAVIRSGDGGNNLSSRRDQRWAEERPRRIAEAAARKEQRIADWKAQQANITQL